VLPVEPTVGNEVQEGIKLAPREKGKKEKDVAKVDRGDPLWLIPW